MTNLKKWESKEEELEWWYRNNENFKFIVDLYYDYLDVKTVKLQHTACILTCKNRKPSLLDTIEQISSPVEVYIYETEKELYDWLERPNVTKVYVPEEYRTCQRMRQFIQLNCKEKKYWMLDDDLIGAQVARKLKPVSVWKALWITEKVIEKEAPSGYAMLMPNMCDISARMWEGQKLVRGAEFCHQAILMDAEELERLRAKFTGDTTVHEDVEIAIDIYKAGGKCGSVEGVIITPIMNPKASIASSEEHLREMVLDGYIKFGECCKLVAKKNKEVINVHVSRKNCKPGMKVTWNKTILKHCKNRDFEKVYKYIINKKNKKD